MQPASDWFGAEPAGKAGKGWSAGRWCVQPAGSVVLLPEGWSHATLNMPPADSGEAGAGHGGADGRGDPARQGDEDEVGAGPWVVGFGRQRAWRAEHRLAASESVIDAERPLESATAVLNAGLALRAMACANPPSSLLAERSSSS